MEQLTLGEFIDQLEKLPLKYENHEGNIKSKLITFDFCNFSPVDLYSWRGSYEMTALGFDQDVNVYADRFLKFCKEMIGNTMTGYKGGEYTIKRNILLWISEKNRASETGITGLRSDSFCIVINTAKFEY